MGTDAPTGLRIGKRGRVAPSGATLKYGIVGSTAVCICDQGWAGPMCSKPCPYPYNATNGICVLRNASDIRDDPVDRKWSTRIVCGPSWTGLPPADVRLPTGAIGAPGRDCSLRCSTCDAAGGTCQDGGDCLCSYGYLWQGPSPGKQGTFPYPQLNLPRDVFNATYHSCATRHPCNSNGEYINATCVGTIVPGKGTAWTQAAPLDGGCVSWLAPLAACETACSRLALAGGAARTGHRRRPTCALAAPSCLRWLTLTWMQPRASPRA